MTVIDVEKDPQARTLALTARFDQAAPERVWQVWADPRQLERWWGPPAYPASVVNHDLTPCGSVTYFMTGPDGDRHHGWWHMLAVDQPRSLEFDDGFADDTGRPNPELPVTRINVVLDPEGQTGTRMQVMSTFPDLETMERLEEMGMVEGMREAMSQIPTVLGAAETR